MRTKEVPNIRKFSAYEIFWIYSMPQTRDFGFSKFNMQINRWQPQ